MGAGWVCRWPGSCKSSDGTGEVDGWGAIRLRTNWWRGFMDVYLFFLVFSRVLRSEVYVIMHQGQDYV